jgi:hypothetical protein
MSIQELLGMTETNQKGWNDIVGYSHELGKLEQLFSLGIVVSKVENWLLRNKDCLQ